jgi:hypothetical protein
MSKNEPTNEIFIRLLVAVNSSDKFEQLLDFIKKSNIFPTKIWTKGDYSAPNNKGYIHKDYGFEIAEKHFSEDLIEELVVAFFKKFPINFKKINQIHCNKKFLSVVIYSYGNMPCIYYGQDIIKFLHVNKIDLDHDIYCLGNKDDEETDNYWGRKNGNI